MVAHITLCRGHHQYLVTSYDIAVDIRQQDSMSVFKSWAMCDRRHIFSEANYLMRLKISHQCCFAVRDKPLF